MWICRAGKDACFIDKVKKTSRIYLFWDGYKDDLSNCVSMNDFRKIVEEERRDEHKTSISNWSSQLFAFCRGIEKDELILIPYYKAQKYMLCKVTGNYDYCESSKYPHSRKIEIIQDEIPKSIFPQDVVYSLNAFRSIYRVKKEDTILEIIKDKG